METSNVVVPESLGKAEQTFWEHTFGKRVIKKKGKGHNWKGTA